MFAQIKAFGSSMISVGKANPAQAVGFMVLGAGVDRAVVTPACRFVGPKFSNLGVVKAVKEAAGNVVSKKETSEDEVAEVTAVQSDLVYAVVDELRKSNQSSEEVAKNLQETITKVGDAAESMKKNLEG